jgi:HNH endonuclease
MRGKLSKQTVIILEMLKYPLRQQVIAKIFDVSHQRINQLAKRHGIKSLRTGRKKIEHKTPPLWDRFIKNVHETKSCWFWTGNKHSYGYGILKDKGGTLLAHRLAPYFFRGIQVPDHLNVLHICDTPQCVNPDHLRLGTAKENTLDSISKGVMRGGHPLK